MLALAMLTPLPWLGTWTRTLSAGKGSPLTQTTRRGTERKKGRLEGKESCRQQSSRDNAEPEI
jgi:hypothetical protein